MDTEGGNEKESDVEGGEQRMWKRGGICKKGERECGGGAGKTWKEARRKCEGTRLDSKYCTLKP